MGIKKSRQASFKRVRSGFAVSKNVIKRTAVSIDPLKTGDTDDGGHQIYIDPTVYMTDKQKKVWRRLSPSRRRSYIRQAVRDIRQWQSAANKGTILRDDNKTLDIMSATSEKRDDKAVLKSVSRRELFRDKKNHQAVPPIKGSNDAAGKKDIGPDVSSSGSGYQDTASKKKDQFLVSGGKPDPGVKGRAMRTDPSPGIIEKTDSVTGAGIARQVSKKAAMYFKTDLENRMSSQQMRIQQEKREAVSGTGSVDRTEEPATSRIMKIFLPILHLAGAVMTSMLSVAGAMMIPIAITVAIIAFGLSLLGGIGGAVDEMDSYYIGGGQELISVAVREIGYREEDNGSNKYGSWCGIGNASWCHAFISWCANECGYIEDGTIPKTGACETGRQWFIHRDEYQTKGSYEPHPGDIVYFRHGSETVSHHVGIVEYAENGVIHTIEGNSGGVVKRRQYPLDADRIMGYGTPAYPDFGIDAYGSASDFLKAAETLGKTIVSDGNWIYSNNGCQKNLDDARRASQPKTNCAAGVSLAMQEFGTLKKNQLLYSDSAGRLCCGSAVRKRINQYYDVIDVGGKKKAKGFALKPGDICLWNGHVNIYAGVSGGKKTWIDFGRKQTSDHKAESGHYVRYIYKGEYPTTLYHVLRLKDQDTYGSGKQIRIPAGLGDTYTYMGWAIIHNWPTRQNYLRRRSGEHYDRHGFAVVDGRYVIACTTTFGKVGDHIDFVLDNGKVIHAIMGDEKNQSDDGCNRWGHDNGHSVVEFVVNKQMWYDHLGNSDITRFHPEWKSRVKMGVNLGKNFFDK